MPLIKTQQSLQFGDDKIIPRSQPQELSLRIKNFFDYEIRGKLRLKISDETKGWEFSKRSFDFVLAPNEVWTGNFEITIPSTVLSGRRPISISSSISSPGERGTHYIEVLRDLEIIRLVEAKYELDESGKVAHFTLTNITDTPLQLYCYTGLAGYATQENSINLVFRF